MTLWFAPAIPGAPADAPALLHPGDDWPRWPTPVGDAWADGEAVWLPHRGGWIVAALPGIPQIVAVADRALAWTADAQVRATAEGLERNEDPARRLGLDMELRWNGGWDAPFPLPLGASRARSTVPFPTGRGALWSAAGFVYRASDGVEALAPAAPFAAGPRGAVLFGDRAAAPGRPAVPHHRSVDLAAPLAWSPDGTAVDAYDDAGSTALLRLAPGDAVAQTTPGVSGADPAVLGDRLAGPGGAVWDLSACARLTPLGALPPGPCVGVGDRFYAADWESGRGSCVTAAGVAAPGFALPLPPDDVVAFAVAVDGAPVFVSALGKAWAVAGATATPVRAPRRPAPDHRPSPIPVDVRARVGDTWFGARKDGLLVRWPA